MKEVARIQSKAKDFLALLEKVKTVGLAGHVHPDGDSLGAMLGLKACLERAGKKVFVYGDPKDISENYRFLPGISEIINDENIVPQLFISLDCPNPSRLGKFADTFKKSAYKVNIDHHSDNENFADLNIVSLNLSSTSEIVFWLLKECNTGFPPEAARALYVGIVTDTGRFQYSNTFPSTFEAAKELVEMGVKPVDIFRAVYENVRPEVLKMLGIILERVNHKNGFYWSYLLKDDFSRFQVTPAETENFIDYIRSIKGVEVAAIFKSFSDDSTKWKVSMRSRGSVNVQKLCAVFGGGGHPEASGCEIEGQLMEAVEKVYQQYLKLKKQED